MRLGDNIEVRSTLLDLNATGDVFEYRPSVPVRVIRWGVVCGVALTGTATLDLDRITYATDGSATRENNPGATQLTVAAGALVLGEVQYCEPAENNEILVKPGDALIFQQSNGWTAGDGYLFLQLQMLNWDDTGVNAQFNDAVALGKLTDVGVAVTPT